MHPLKKIILLLLSWLACVLISDAQSAELPGNKRLVFSAIKGNLSKPDSILLPASAYKRVKSIKITGGDAASFKMISAVIPAKKDGKAIIVFKPAADFVGLKKSTLQLMGSAGKLIEEIPMTGLSTNGLEGENEPALARIVNALGYSINIGWTTLANHSRPELQGDELNASLFRKADSGTVEMIPLARYSPDFELLFGYYINGIQGPDKHYTGVLAKTGRYPEHQTLFPAMAAGSASFDPGNNAFGFYASGPSHSLYSEDAWNMLFHPEHAVHAMRIYQLKDENGIEINHNYLLCMEEAKNGDYNDYVFLIKNIFPVTGRPFINLFNGKDLTGWYSFLKDKGINNDPDHNFRIEDGVIHVLGKELGYIMTDTGFHNYHFKVDFKWGMKKWPPREDAKRDAGICYNIPMQEPDTIWPKSIECQIQEGDVGDFWLLSFSTITVNGVQNIPSNHTRMIKMRDGEKPYGEWNTVEVISYNGRCVHVVNGVIVNAGENSSVIGGKILLQSEYAEVYYRNIQIRPL